MYIYIYIYIHKCIYIYIYIWHNFVIDLNLFICRFEANKSAISPFLGGTTNNGKRAPTMDVNGEKNVLHIQSSQCKRRYWRSLLIFPLVFQ